MMLTIKYKVNYADLADGFWQELEREGESERERKSACLTLSLLCFVYL